MEEKRIARRVRYTGIQKVHIAFFYTAMPAAWPDDQAHWKLKPPR